MTPDPFAASAGAYVLGALSAEERHAFELHLRECAECRAEVHSLAGLPGLLSRVPLRDVLADDTSEPPPTLLPGLLNRVRRARRARRTALIGSLALAACIIAVLAVIIVPGTGRAPAPAPTPTPAAFAMTQVTPGPIHATARVSDVPGGSKIDMDCIYRATARNGWTSERAYTLTVQDRYGQSHRVATWRIASGETSLSSALSVTRDDIRVIQIRDAKNKVLLRLRWPPPSPHTHPS
ncbi:MAG TPA: zf-HC2 domain-containing protein [Streptosporangiaceae bacterium]|jgi:anti-sigma-K factor RskA